MLPYLGKNIVNDELINYLMRVNLKNWKYWYYKANDWSMQESS